MEPTHTDDDALMSPAATQAMTGGLSEATLRRRMKSGDFPRPVVIGRTANGRAARIAWRRGDVLAWCRRQVEADRKHSAAA